MRHRQDRPGAGRPSEGWPGGEGRPLKPGKKGLLLVPEFPRDSFWSYRYIIRLIGRRAAFPPLGVLTFAGYLPDWELELVDLNVRRPSDQALRRKIEEADVAFVSAMSIQKRSLVEVLERPAAGLDTPFVLGGAFASSYRDQILSPETDSDRTLHDGLDILVWGEAGASIEELREWLASDPVHRPDTPRLIIPRPVAEAEPGSRRYLNDRSIFQPLRVPLPRWDLIRVKDYHSMMIQTTAGCPFRCDFCDIIQFNGGFNRSKTPEDVTAELEAILATGYRGSVFSVDDNFIGQPRAISVILDAMTEFQRTHDYPFSFYTQASVNLGTPKLEHLIQKMKVAGFDAVFLGIESPDEEALRRMNKKQNLKVDVPGTIARIQEAGMEVYGGFIFGTDEDTPSTADRIIEFVKGTKIFTAMAGMLTPVPHTPLHERLREEGRLLPAEFTGNNTDDEIQLDPRGMSPEEMRGGIHHILSSLFDPREAYRRGAEMLAAVKPHIFHRRRMEPAYLKAVLVSIWKQGIARMDPAYFRLLWRGFRMDWQEYRRSRREARGLGRRLRELRKALGESAAAEVEAGRQRLDEWLEASGRRERLDELLERARKRKRLDEVLDLTRSRERLDELVGLAQDYLVRFRPEESLDGVRTRVAGLREKVGEGMPDVAELGAVLEAARGHLRARMALHRFPGVKLVGAFEAAIKGLHYEKVMRSVTAGGAGARARASRDQRAGRPVQVRRR